MRVGLFSAALLIAYTQGINLQSSTQNWWTAEKYAEGDWEQINGAWKWTAWKDMNYGSEGEEGGNQEGENQEGGNQEKDNQEGENQEGGDQEKDNQEGGDQEGDDGAAIVKPDPIAPVAGGLKVTKTKDEAIAKYFPKTAVVFGVTVFGESATPDAKILHAASVLAQYLDNDQDGVADNKVACWMKTDRSVLVMPATQESWDRINKNDQVNLLIESKGYGVKQDLNARETQPGSLDPFDATLEEVLHLVTNGYVGTWPKVFATRKTSKLTAAMDIARGGKFTTIPKPYPSSAWYTYDDATCEYGCMGFEYFYWTLTSMLGAQETRTDTIANEWKANTRALVKEKDPTMYAIFNDPKYNMVTKLPSGAYTAQDTDPCK